MKEIKYPSIVLKEILDQDDYNDINELKNICLRQDKTSLKLELDYKLSRYNSSEDKNTRYDVLYRSS